MKAQIISFHCVLKDPLGRIISSSFNHDVLTEKPSISPHRKMTPSPGQSCGASDHHEQLKALNDRLQNLKKGEKRRIFLSAEEAYGLYDPELLIEVARKKLPRGRSLQIGYQVVTRSQDGEWRLFRVIAADSNRVTLDGNHPLAGQDLLFDIEATSARDATAEELERAQKPAQTLLLH